MLSGHTGCCWGPRAWPSCRRRLWTLWYHPVQQAEKTFHMKTPQHASQCLNIHLNIWVYMYNHSLVHFIPKLRMGLFFTSFFLFIYFSVVPNTNHFLLWSLPHKGQHFITSTLKGAFGYSRLLYNLIREIKTRLNINHITVHNNTYCIT